MFANKRCFVIFLFITPFLLLAQKKGAIDTYYQTSTIQPVMVQYEADRSALARFYTVTNSPERRERFKKLTSDIKNL